MKKRKYCRIIWIWYKKLQEAGINFQRPRNWTKLKKYENRKNRKFLNDNNSNSNLKNKQDKLTLPAIIDFGSNLKNIKNLLEEIKLYKKLSHSNTKIDLSKLNNISINGLVFLISEIDKIQNHKKLSKTNFHHGFKYNNKYGINKSNEKLKYLLYKVGYWNYFSIKKPYKINEDIKNEYFLSITTDVLSKSSCVADLREFIGNKVDFFQTDIIQDCFDDAITEAMANSVEHGYIIDTPNRTHGKWWLCGHYDKQNNYLEFSFRDYGVGLRKTLEYNADDKIRSILRGVGNTIKKDSEIIEILVNDKLPKYKSKKDKLRGYGFKQFKQFASNIGYDCEMKIISGSGQYVYSHESGMSDKEVLTNMDFEIDGVLISWKIYLEGKKK